jgi:hypothetical protein
MPRTTITPHTVPTGKDAYTAGTVTETAADTANLNQTPLTGKEMLVVRNSAGVSGTVTITSVADPTHGRTGDVAAVSVPAGAVRRFGPFPLEGWRQTDNMLYFQGSAATMLFTVYKLP